MCARVRYGVNNEQMSLRLDGTGATAIGCRYRRCRFDWIRDSGNSCNSCVGPGNPGGRSNVGEV